MISKVVAATCDRNAGPESRFASSLTRRLELELRFLKSDRGARWLLRCKILRRRNRRRLVHFTLDGSTISTFLFRSGLVGRSRILDLGWQVRRGLQLRRLVALARLPLERLRALLLLILRLLMLFCV